MPNGFNPNAFHGDLHVEPCDFDMYVSRMIFREHSVVFDAHGRILKGENAGQRYRANAIELGLERDAPYYSGSGYLADSETKCRIWLLQHSRETLGECHIAGIWFDYEDENDDPSSGWLWTFYGVLHQIMEE